MGRQMDALAALSQAAKATRPGVRDRLPVMAIAMVAYVLALAGLPSRFDLQVALTRLAALDFSGFLLLSVLLIAAAILFEPLLVHGHGKVPTGGQVRSPLVAK